MVQGSDFADYATLASAAKRQRVAPEVVLVNPQAAEHETQAADDARKRIMAHAASVNTNTIVNALLAQLHAERRCDACALGACKAQHTSTSRFRLHTGVTLIHYSSLKAMDGMLAFWHPVSASSSHLGSKPPIPATCLIPHDLRRSAAWHCSCLAACLALMTC